MNGRKTKQIRKMIAKLDPNLLLAVRNEYGEQTKEMTPHQLLKAAKKLYKRGLLKI